MKGMTAGSDNYEIPTIDDETVVMSITVGIAVFGLSFNMRSIKYSDSKFRNVKYEDKL